ncbi:serine/threonine-protein kinase prp4 isoform X2 [Setaria italica]|uniref:serine/threonine-protein kinase prp4 isoform X2 n=1 Tax=Setaria italica TaxID=4555 RepID=UPI000BE56B98|nr:serine/threonine-protein kinase prp4 isoform X2 [Setaria italica]
MDREDAEEGSVPKRHKRSHHRHHQDRGNPGEAAGAEARVGPASLASGEPGEGAIAQDEGAANAADAGRALAPAPEPDNNSDANLVRSPQSQRVKEENHKDADLNDPKSREETEEKFEQLVPKLGGNDREKHKAEARKRADVTPTKYGEIQLQKQQQEIVHCSNNEGLGEGIPMSERSEDIFANDIFGESPIGAQELGKKRSFLIKENAHCDNWDDPGGYYTYHCGEVLHGRYEIMAGHGMGVFSNVVRAKDLKAGKGDSSEVAIKIIRNIPVMYKAGKQEISILEKLASADPKDRRHCVRFISSFMYRNHLCLIFESLHMNLRELLKKFGSDVGLKLTAVRTYSKQLFIALKHLKSCNVLHCDIKPDNVLVNEAKTKLKLCDFGSAMPTGTNEITPYLVSRFYRAPEIILGLPYNHPLDMWSVGCSLFELYTGKLLFPGKTNNDMLRLHMESKGALPKKMLRKGTFAKEHFDQDFKYFHEKDPVTKMTVKRHPVMNIKRQDVSSVVSSFPGEDPKMLFNFNDLLKRILVLDPEKRLKVEQALSHPFVSGK